MSGRPGELVLERVEGAKRPAVSGALHVDAIPLEFWSEPRWIVFKVEPPRKRGEKPKKIPYRLDLKHRAASTKPADWGDVETAIGVVDAGKADGIGYALPDREFTLVDLDDAVNGDGTLHSAAAAIVAKLDSYAEWSTSGSGVHCVVRGRLPGRSQTSQTPWGGKFEAWDHDRFVYVTGALVTGAPATIEERQAELDHVCAEFLPERPAPAPRAAQPVDLDDRELLERAFAAKHGDEFRDLYEGRWQGRYGSQSEADLALTARLTFWAGCDATRVDSLFRSSGLARAKWDEPRGEETYGSLTVAKAAAGAGDVFSPASPRSGQGDEPPGPSPAGEVGDAVGMRITRIADVTSRRVEWLDEGLIARGMLTGLVAPGGTVKGLLGIHEAVKISWRGERTLFVCSEDALDYIVRPRFQAAGCDAKLAFALSIQSATGERVPHFPSDLPVLEDAIEEVRPQLVIVDPIASYIDLGLDMGKNNEMRLILQPLITLARDTNVAILVIYHLGKNRERGAIGSVAFEDACRQVLTAARDDDDEDVRHVELTKSNIGPTGYGRKLRIVGVPLDIDGEVVEVAKLVDEGRSGKSVLTLLAKRGAPGPEPEKREHARELLIEALVAAGTSGVNANEVKRVVAEKAGVSAPTVWRAFVELKAEELAIGEPIRDEFGSILEWRWAPRLSLLVGRNDA